MNWISLRERPLYREMKLAIETALQNYWEVAATEKNCNEVIASCDDVVLTSFRLLKYIRNQIGGLVHYVDEKKIGKETNDAVGDFYCLGEGTSTSLQEESDVLEILSRSAYRELIVTKNIKKVLESEGEDY